MTATAPLLFERFPRLAEAVVPLPLGTWPTPVAPLATEAGDVWVKREDLSSPRYGGSKVRNLEWILGDARRRERRTLLTTAAWGSHLVLALARHGVASGFKVRAILYPQPPSEEVEETQRLVRDAGAVVSRCRTSLELPFRLASQWNRARREDGAAPYWVAPGGASALGCLGYVQAAYELEAQVAAGELPRPDYIHCAAGSCGTVVGLAQGLGLIGWETVVVGTRVVPRPVTSAMRRRGMARALARLLREFTGESPPPPAKTVIRHGHAGRGYAVPTPEGVALVEEMRATEGLELETTYTGKALASLREFLREEGTERRTHLFLQTFSPGRSGTG